MREFSIPDVILAAGVTRGVIEREKREAAGAALDAWLRALGIGSCQLVGQSLGTVIAARFAAEQPRWVGSLTLAGVARGMGGFLRRSGSGFSRRRLDDLTRLGQHEMAVKRGPRLLGPEATETM